MAAAAAAAAGGGAGSKSTLPGAPSKEDSDLMAEVLAVLEEDEGTSGGATGGLGGGARVSGMGRGATIHVGGGASARVSATEGLLGLSFSHGVMMQAQNAEGGDGRVGDGRVVNQVNIVGVGGAARTVVAGMSMDSKVPSSSGAVVPQYKTGGTGAGKNATSGRGASWEQQVGYDSGFVTAVPISRSRQDGEMRRGQKGPGRLFGVLVMQNRKQHLSRTQWDLLALIMPSVAAALSAAEGVGRHIETSRLTLDVCTAAPNQVVFKLGVDGKLEWTNYPFHLPNAQLSNVHVGNHRRRSFHIDPRGNRVGLQLTSSSLETAKALGYKSWLGVMTDRDMEESKLQVKSLKNISIQCSEICSQICSLRNENIHTVT